MGKTVLETTYYPPPRGTPSSKHAADALIETIQQNPGIVVSRWGR